MAKTGRPKKNIDIDAFEELCKIQCTEEEICNVLNVDDKTLTRWCKETYECSFSEIFKIKRQGGRTSLRRTQWNQAQNSVPMAIWLGKQYLKQRDKFEDEENERMDATIKQLENMEVKFVDASGRKEND